MEKNYLEVAQQWLGNDYDEDTRKEVKDLMDNNPKELEESFYRMLEFGTGGLRGIMGVGTNRMNKYTVGKATQGLANYILEQGTQDKGVAISYDSRRKSDEFFFLSSEIL